MDRNRRLSFPPRMHQHPSLHAFGTHDWVIVELLEPGKMIVTRVGDDRDLKTFLGLGAEAKRSLKG